MTGAKSCRPSDYDFYKLINDVASEIVTADVAYRLITVPIDYHKPRQDDPGLAMLSYLGSSIITFRNPVLRVHFYLNFIGRVLFQVVGQVNVIGNYVLITSYAASM